MSGAKDVNCNRIFSIPIHMLVCDNVSFFKEKQQIKSHIKLLPRGEKFGVADDVPKEVDLIRMELYPELK